VKSLKVIKGKKRFTVKWKKQSANNQKKFNGYQIRYSLKSNMSIAKYVTAPKSSKSKTIKKLKAKKKYFVQVRTYTNSKGSTFYSSWSPIKKVKTK
jgi:minor extracellular protease Epr